MRLDYLSSAHLQHHDTQPNATGQQTAHAFRLTLENAIASKTPLSEAPPVGLVVDSKPQVPGPLESSYRVLAESVEPRREPRGRVMPGVDYNCRTLRRAEANVNDAWEAVALYAFTSFEGPLLDITDPENIRYSATGELVTPESTAYYAKAAAALDRRLVEIFHQERNMGTPPAEILSKLFTVIETQPRGFLEMAAW